ncbi:hypothetical protein ILYODFUR_002814 [Ilyodon furcidens]|uniref:Uncharacterized protein n=1 Tax=Ilyodon furcidens TaxID=33524 RepID=A0ABV0USG8_9TELE
MSYHLHITGTLVYVLVFLFQAAPSRGSVKLLPKPETEEKPRKPPPPTKTPASKPELPSAEKKPLIIRPEDRADKPTPEPKPLKPPAPNPHKKPVPLPPKKPEKPIAPSLNLKHNGEVPSTRPKSDFEPVLPTKPKTLSGDWGEKPSDTGTHAKYRLNSPNPPCFSELILKSRADI